MTFPKSNDGVRDLDVQESVLDSLQITIYDFFFFLVRILPRLDCTVLMYTLKKHYCVFTAVSFRYGIFIKLFKYLYTCYTSIFKFKYTNSNRVLNNNNNNTRNKTN